MFNKVFYVFRSSQMMQLHDIRRREGGERLQPAQTSGVLQVAQKETAELEYINLRGLFFDEFKLSQNL